MNHQNPQLSIVSVTRNNPGGLATTLHSIGCQSRIALDATEVLVIDGGTDTESLAVVRDAKIPHLVHRRESDTGVYDAMNKGWRTSGSGYIQFLNAGDRFHDPLALAHILRVLSEAPATPWFIFGATILGTADGVPAVVGNIPHRWWRHAVGLQPHCHQSTIFSRPCLEMVNGMDEGLDIVADHDLILRCGLLSSPVEDATIVVDYEGNGMSARRHLELPKLLHRARVHRMELSSGVARLSQAWAILMTGRLRLARLAGALRRLRSTKDQ